MSEINAVSGSQIIVVEPASRSISVIQSGPQGPPGPSGEYEALYVSGVYPTAGVNGELLPMDEEDGYLGYVEDTGHMWLFELEPPPARWIDMGPLQGPAGPAGPAGADSGDPASVSYRHIQANASTIWTIIHGLSFRPNVSVVDSTLREIEPGSIDYPDAATVVLTFSAAVGGEAYLS